MHLILSAQVEEINCFKLLKDISYLSEIKESDWVTPIILLVP